ncbi:hypothetical protein [Methylocystis sp. ATCC 49242]|uniref:hypothetical protein n=1 Tax=Methylocystis sp. ATCC 49242 TaxID=622637 RepID=UPI0005698DEE|nr:hypothetical protein [Methylocystis sp. ATCC 49242]
MRPSPENAELQAVIDKLRAAGEAERRKVEHRRVQAGYRQAGREPVDSESARIVAEYRRRAAIIRAARPPYSRTQLIAIFVQYKLFFAERRLPDELETIRDR